jgi:RNA polymerase sigma-70 factor (ECF subfamily)
MARLPGRQDGSGGLLLLEEQDRTRWDAGQMQEGISWLARSASGEVLSRYHAEAAIAAEHCLAPSFAATRWERIVECYDALARMEPSPLHALNRAIAIAELRGPEEGLRALQALQPPAWLEASHLWPAVLSDLHRRCGHAPEAEHYRSLALASAPTPAIGELLRRRLDGRAEGIRPAPPAARLVPSNAR